MASGPAERAFVRASRSTGSRVRGVQAIVVQSAVLLVTPAAHLVPMLVSLVVVVPWLIFCMVLMYREEHPWALWVDTAMLCTLCLLQPLLDVSSLVRDDAGWIYLVTESGLIVHQWQYRRRPAAVATVLISAAYCVGSLRMGELPVVTTFVTTAWLLFTPQVSRWIRTAMQLAAHRADEASAAHEQAQRDIEVADALRESETTHLAMLHDTVASTLLMVGVGAAPPGPRLRAQASQDLAVLTAATAPERAAPRDVADQLARVIRPIVEAGDLRIGFTRVGPTAVLPGPVSEAFAGAVGESLRNVARHATANRADVELDTRDARVQVRVRDDGRGFAPDSRPGRGIRFSITERMERAGGRAGVSSTRAGVLVELSWSFPKEPER